MSLVMAVVCTDGIVVSGDFRISKPTINSVTGERNVSEWKDSSHKIILTNTNRIVGHTGNAYLQSGESVHDAIKNALFVSEMLKLPTYEEFLRLIMTVKDNNNSIIEAGIIDGQYTVLVWGANDTEISINHHGGAIGATDYLQQQNILIKGGHFTTEEAKALLIKINQETAKIDKTVSPECEILEIH